MKHKEIIVTKIIDNSPKPKSIRSVPPISFMNISCMACTTFKVISYIVCIILFLLGIAILVYGFSMHFENTALSGCLLIATSILLFLLSKYLFNRMLKLAQWFWSKVLRENESAKFLLILMIDGFGIFLFFLPALTHQVSFTGLVPYINYLFETDKSSTDTLFKLISTIGLLIAGIGLLISEWGLIKFFDNYDN